MVCLDPSNGKVIWVAELDTPTFLRASPTGADGKIYVMDAEGTVVVVAASNEFQELGRNHFASYPSRSAVVPLASPSGGGQLLVRTAKHLYCIEDVSAVKSPSDR